MPWECLASLDPLKDGVSNGKQGASGLGLEAQRKAVLDYLNGGRWKLVADFTEVESGKLSERPQLKQALALCRIHRATLVGASQAGKCRGQ
jgi:DNA invertase Pin-like site-specific DNA recombinase